MISGSGIEEIPTTVDPVATIDFCAVCRVRLDVSTAMFKCFQETLE